MGGEDARQGITRANWALLLIDLGRYGEAVTICREVLAHREKGGPVDPASVADALEYLAMALQGEGRLAEAEAAARRSLTLRERNLRPEDRDIPRSRNLLGAVLRDRGALNAAESLLRGALADRRRLLGPDHAEVAVSLEDLGDLLAARTRYAEAEATFAEAARILNASFPGDHPWITRVEAGRAAAHVRATGCAEGIDALVRSLDRLPGRDRRAVRGRQVLEQCLESVPGITGIP